MSNVADGIRQWWTGMFRQSELDRLGELGVERIATEAGVSVNDLYELTRHGPDSAELLSRRLRALDLDPALIAHEQPQDFRDMQRLCSLCESKGRCERDLSLNPENSIWSYYCPNAETIRALR
jgi:hypothetical protein